MTDEDALRAGVRAAPLDGTPRLVLADFLDDHDRPEEAALHRVIARRGDPESLRLLAAHTGGDSADAAHHTEIANETELAVRPRSSNNTAAEARAHRAMDMAASGRYPVGPHNDAAEIHRVHAGNLHRRAENIDGEGGHWDREARVLRDALEHHLTAAALHEAAAYHHANHGAK